MSSERERERVAVALRVIESDATTILRRGETLDLTATAEHIRDQAREAAALLRAEPVGEPVNHCKDCCCARSWEALGITAHTGLSIPEHIRMLREENERLRPSAAALHTRQQGGGA